MPLISNGTTEQLPAWVRQPMRTKQASEVPWRKNLKSTGGGPAAPAATTTTATNAHKPPPSTTSAPEQPKATKLQINLKSVKKPDTPTQPTQTEKLPPVQLNPVLPENKTTTNKPPTGKTIPIQIQKTSTAAGEPAKPPAATTTIPIQRPHNDPPKNKATPIKTESKVKPKPVEANSTKSKKASADPVPPAPENKMAPPPPPAPPAPPPPPGAPPPPPPPPGGLNAGLPPKSPKPPHVHAKIESLKKAPRKRPDWANMMKEIETGRKLKHVQCNDRSKPIIPKSKSRGKFVFDSEAKPANKADALHNRLLNEIQSGVKLKKVQCNDRSKPHLSGLRFRRQSSVADSDVQKVNETIPEQEELEFVMDIDVLRDELQSAKQMLENEVESKHNIEKKNRDQKCQIIAMEAEIETLKAKLGLIPEDEVSMLAKGLDRSDSRTFKHLRKSGSGLWKSPSIVGIKRSKSGITKELLTKPPQQDASKNEQQPQQQEEDFAEVSEFEEEISSLKQAVQHARKQAEEMEKKYKETMEKLLVAQGTLEDSEQKRRVLEKKVEQLQANGNTIAAPIVQTAERTTQTEEQILERMLTRQQSTREDGTTQDGLFTDSEEEDSDVEVDEETVQRKKEEREIKLWENKLKSIKDKQHASRLERKNLKNLQKKLEQELKEAKKRHKQLQKEVDKMAKMLKDVEKAEDEEDDEEEEEKEEATEEEAEESEEEESEEEESESESNDDDEESSEEDDEDAEHEERLGLYGRRVKRRENVLNALRKGNYLLRANIDRLKDDLEEARISYHDLEHELSSVLDDM